MHDLELLHDLAVVMLVAGITTILCHRLKQPVALGYIVAGFIIGPYTPPFELVKNEETVKTLGEMGVVLLMFSLGLEFSLRKLTRVGLSAFVAAMLEIALMIWLGYEVGRAFGWNTMDSVFLGAMLSISSTTIIVKALRGTGQIAGGLRRNHLRHPRYRGHPGHHSPGAAFGLCPDGIAPCRAGRNRDRQARRLFRDGPRGRIHRRAAALQLHRQIQKRRDAPGHGARTLLRGRARGLR